MTLLPKYLHISAFWVMIPAADVEVGTLSVPNISARKEPWLKANAGILTPAFLLLTISSSQKPDIIGPAMTPWGPPDVLKSVFIVTNWYYNKNYIFGFSVSPQTFREGRGLETELTTNGQWFHQPRLCNGTSIKPLNNKVGRARWNLFWGQQQNSLLSLSRDMAASSLHTSLAGAKTCLWEVQDYALNQLEKWMTCSSEDIVIFIYSPTGTASLWKSCLKMSPHIPLRETFRGRLLTMSFLKGYSKLKVLASIPAWLIEGKEATPKEIKYNYSVNQQNGQVNPNASAYHGAVLKRN